MNKKVRPLRAYAAPAYPTSVEIDRADLSRVPVRWRRLRTVASTLGAAAMSLKALALEAQEAPKPMASAPVVAVPDAETPKAVAQKPVTDVCPLPVKEIAGDGAGAFGCIAMNPPVILPESEALDIIEKEFAKRGVTLKDCAVLEDVEMPDLEWFGKLPEHERARIRYASAHGGAWPEPPRTRKRCLMDFGTPDGRLLVEYVSRWDQDHWIQDPWGGSTVSSVLTREAAEEMVKGLAARTTGKPVSVGVFYDPCVRLPKGWKPTYPEGMTEDDRGAWDVEWKQRCAKGAELAREKLVAQIEHFFKYLEKHPVK